MQTRRRQRHFTYAGIFVISILIIISFRSIFYQAPFKAPVNNPKANFVEIPVSIATDVVSTSLSTKRKTTLPPRSEFPEVRRNLTSRRFTSQSVDGLIDKIKKSVLNVEIGWLFENCFPNTLDTTVDFEPKTGEKNRPDTYVITGDIDAMWLRDSSAQVSPYLPLISVDSRLRLMIEGVILRQSLFIQRDPYANAHYKDVNRTSEWKHMDQTEMRPGVHERKWELDSLCYVIRLMYSYWKEIDLDITFFTENKDDLQKTIRIILKTMKEQQRFNGSGNLKKSTSSCDTNESMLDAKLV